MKTLSTSELKDMLSRHADIVLINVLPHEAFHRQHIAGSANVPVDDDDFVRKVRDLVPDKRRKIVVYCADTACDASDQAARQLQSAGYINLFRYPEGMAGWRQAGQSVVESAV